VETDLTILDTSTSVSGTDEEVSRYPTRRIVTVRTKPVTRLERRALLLLVSIVSLALGWILLPFFGTIMWSAIIALLFMSLHRWFLVRLGQRRTASAIVTLFVVLVIVILPVALLTASLAREAILVYEGLRSGDLNPEFYLQGVFNALPSWFSALLNRFGLVDFSTLQQRLAAALMQASQFIAMHTLSIGQNAFNLVANVFITLYLAYFMIRDGEGLVRAVRDAIPLAPQHKQELFETFTTVIRATVKGTLIIAMIQGVLGGIAFWFLDVRSALLWGVLMGFLSLLPVIGAGLVWVPVAIFLVVAGAVWQGVALIAYGVLVISLVDNLLRPMLVGKDTHMPDYIVLITTLGGIAVFGANGFVVGPAIAAMFIAVWQIYRPPPMLEPLP